MRLEAEKTFVLEPSLETVVSELHAAAFDRTEVEPDDEKLTYIARPALALDKAVEVSLLAREERSRAKGSSYLEKLAAPLGKWPPSGKSKSPWSNPR
jgi:hypothetical protein